MHGGGGGGGDDDDGLFDDHDDDEWDGTNPWLAAVAVGVVFGFGRRGRAAREADEHAGESILQRIRRQKAEAAAASN